MDDDFNTAKVMGHLFETAKIVNALDINSTHASFIVNEVKDIFDSLGTGVFGITFESATQTDHLVDDLVKLFIEMREEARKEKNWALADKIRDRLKETGVALEDRSDGTTWKII